MMRASFLNVSFFSYFPFWAKAEKREEAVKDAFEAETTADYKEENYACEDADDYAGDCTTAEAVVSC